MKHLENIQQLFGRNFVEHPLIESFEAGKIHLSSGRIVACDPLITKEMPPISTVFPKGEFRVLVHRERESNCIAYVEVIFTENPIKEWRIATPEGSTDTALAEGEIFGYPAESGMGCLMDVDAQQSLNALEERLFRRKGADFMGIYEEFFHEKFFDENGAIDQYAFLKPDEEQGGNLFAFETGYGEGFYANYIAFDSEGTPVKIVTELIEILDR